MENRGKWPSMGCVGILLMGALIVAGYFFINHEKVAQAKTIIGASRNLAPFSQIVRDQVKQMPRNPLPAGAIPASMLDQMLVTLEEIPAGEPILETQVVSLGAPSSVDLVVLPIANTVAAKPGDEILLIGVDETLSSRELGSARFLGVKDGKMIAALCRNITLQVAPYNSEKRSLTAVRPLTAEGPSTPATQPVPVRPLCPNVASPGPASTSSP